jgi:hypothetical protein
MLTADSRLVGNLLDAFQQIVTTVRKAEGQ